MIDAFYTAKAGSKNYQSYLDAVANNIANASTTGYKTQNVSFTDLIYSDFDTPQGDRLQSGNGSKLVISRDMSSGSAQMSDSVYDISINGDGFFAVMDASGSIAYTRNLNSRISEYTGESYLVTADGDFILDSDFNKIAVTPGSSLTLFSPAEAKGMAADEASGTAALGIFSFSDPERLTAIGSGKYIATPGSGLVPYTDMKSEIKTGMNESSNVSIASEMVKMIMAQRGFQLNADMIQTADEMEQTANNLGA